MLRKLGKLVALAGIAQAALRYAKSNPDKVNKIADQTGRFVNERTKGKYHSQIDGAVRKIQDATNRPPH
ncbi:MAG TPA: antitoxin [Pseudonocardiaceae bacterium]|nr:antitoxin [Pseudonocardiaceae bacterium]